MKRILALSCVAAAIFACAPGGSFVDDAPPAVSDRADGDGDQADYGCRIVLRSARPIETSDRWGSLHYDFSVTVDIAQTVESELGDVVVLYRTDPAADVWTAASPDASPVMRSGFLSYSFTLDAGLPVGSVGGAVDLIPFARDAEGRRLFDHNRVADSYGTYHLNAENGWTIADDPWACPAPAAREAHYVLTYPDFEETLLDGPVTAGGTLKITYDGRRLRETSPCMGSEGPVSATTIHVGYSFEGETAESGTAEVESYIESYAYGCPGTPCITETDSEPILVVPGRAEWVELWFYCAPGFSYGAPENWQYDSDYGANYWLPIE